jgi:hypothetical protein
VRNVVKEHVVGFLLEERARALATVVAATTLFLSHSYQMPGIFVVIQIFVKTGLGTFLGLTKMYAFLLWVMDLLRLAAIALHMRRSLLALKSTMMTLSDRTTLLGHQSEFSVGMVATADTMSLQARAAGPFRAISLDHHDD